MLQISFCAEIGQITGGCHYLLHDTTYYKQILLIDFGDNNFMKWTLILILAEIAYALHDP